MQKVQTSAAPAAVGPYSQATISGNFVFCSGQIPLSPATMQMTGDTTARQTEQVLLNLKAVLETAGSDLSRVLKTTVFLKNMADFSEMNEVYSRAFGDARPARSTIEIARLPKDALVEIECVAERG